MSLRRFHFETTAQWNTCLFAQADGEQLRVRRSVQPFPAYAREASRLESDGAHAPAVTRTGDILWRDDHGCLWRLTACDERPDRTGAPGAIGRADRMVANQSGLWVIAPDGGSVHRHDDETLGRVLTADLAGAKAIDIADRGRGDVLVLAIKGDTLHGLTVDSAGHGVRALTLRGIEKPLAFAFLRRSKRLVVLGGEREQRLFWFALDADRQPLDVPPDERRPLFSRSVPALHPCFAAQVLGSDGKDRLFLAGQDGVRFGGSSWVLILDVDGNFLGDVPIDASDATPTGVVAARGALFVTGKRGLLRFDTTDVVPEGAGELRTILLTPMLTAPDREDRRRWLRIDATADLPVGSSLEIAYAATADKQMRDRLIRLTSDRKATASERISAVLNETELWRTPTVFHGRTAGTDAEADPFSAKLFDVADPYVWVLITLRAAPGARLPKLTRLDVLYPGRTLMEHLPAIYQREEERADSFLRPLVGVLETTTHGLDTRIKSMSGRLSPSTATTPWLDFVAKWFGVPWDDAMSDAQKRRILTNAPALAGNRGTRAGLELLLESLLPTPKEAPARYRVTDPTADFGFARVGGASCSGSTLPAMLGGRAPWNTELGRDAIIGRMRLPCPGETYDGARHLAGHIKVDIAATGEDRRAMEPWLETVLNDMVPLNTRLKLRWVPPQALRSHRLDGTMTLDGAPSAQLGTGAITGLARLPRGGGRLSRTGPRLSTELR